MTGRRPDTIRVWDLQTHFRETTPGLVTLPQHFKDHGYRSECIGKIYHDPRAARDRQSWSVEETLAFTNEIGGKYVLPENQNRTGSWKAAATECADVPDNAYIDGQVADAAVARIQTLPRDHPFFLAVGFRRPHLPFSAPRCYWGMQCQEAIASPENPDPPSGVPEMALHDWQELRGYTDIPNLGDLSDEQTAHLRHGYYAATSYTDAQIGRVLDALEEGGFGDNTIIVLWSDHGWHLGEHGLWGKTTNFELDTRSPLIISAPGLGIRAKSMSIVEFVDIYPTLVDLCDLPIPPGLEGRSFVPILKNPQHQVKEAALSQFPRGHCMGCSNRTDHYRYTAWIDREQGNIVAEELYDHNCDPLETCNQADNSEHQKNLRTLRKNLLSYPWKSFRR